MLEAKLLPLEDRPFHSYYPKQMDGKWYMSRSLGLHSLGFSSLSNFRYSYSIESPSSLEGKRQYLLTSSLTIMESSYDSLPESFFRGLIGEQVTRILMMEFLRRNSSSLGIYDYNFLKQNNNPNSTSSIIAESATNMAIHLSRYNISIVPKHNEDEPCCEFDGLIEYSFTPRPHDKQNKGLIVCESKTGDLEHYGRAKSSEGKARLEKKIIHPLLELFPNHAIDFMLMANKQNIFYPVNQRSLNANTYPLNELFKKYNIGFIPFYFIDPKSDFESIARDMASLQKSVGKDKVKLKEMIQRETENRWFDQNGFTYLIKGQRIERIIDTSGKVIYRFK
jgi:hypothetical protein